MAVMDYKALLTGKSYNDLMIISDNWYQRLNRLKEKHSEPANVTEGFTAAAYTSEKAQLIGKELMNRLTVLAQIALDHNKRLTPVPSYAEGGYVTATSENRSLRRSEFAVDRKGNISRN